MNRASHILAQLQEASLGAGFASLHDIQEKPRSYTLKANHRKGIRCPDCGRLFPRIEKLPVKRRCPNLLCRKVYTVSKGETGLLLKESFTESIEDISP